MIAFAHRPTSVRLRFLAPSGRSAVNILLVLESDEHVELLRQALAPVDPAILTLFERGADILQCAPSQPPDTVIVGKHLPDMLGSTLINELHHRWDMRPPDLYLFGEEFTYPEIMRAAEAGTDRLLIPPLETDLLVNCILDNE